MNAWHSWRVNGTHQTNHHAADSAIPSSVWLKLWGIRKWRPIQTLDAKTLVKSDVGDLTCRKVRTHGLGRSWYSHIFRTKSSIPLQQSCSTDENEERQVRLHSRENSCRKPTKHWSLSFNNLYCEIQRRDVPLPAEDPALTPIYYVGTLRYDLILQRMQILTERSENKAQKIIDT